MLAHIRSNLLLLLLTFLLCSVAYPLVLWGIGQTFFPNQAEGSLLDKDGKPTTDPAKSVGSRLIARPFNGDEFFQPRPSATSPDAYNAAASGASNWGASQPLLRDRVSRALGTIARYKDKDADTAGALVGPDIEKWFQERPKDYVKQWAESHSISAGQWVKDHSDAVVAFLELKDKAADSVKDDADKYATAFFAKFAEKYPNLWPVWVNEKDKDGKDVMDKDGKPVQKLDAVKEGDDVRAYLFDAWMTAHADAKLEQVPADMVMASGSGLDPHITLKNALYQLDRVAGAWAEKKKAKKESVQAAIKTLLQQKASSPLGGLAGVPLVNVMEVNLSLPSALDKVGG